MAGLFPAIHALATKQCVDARHKAGHDGGARGQIMLSMKSLPRLSLAERDRRWAAVRKQMAARGLDAIVLWGWPTMWDFYTANARYLCPIGGNAEFNVLVFPASGEPTSIIQMPTFLEGWRAAQD